MSGLGLGCLGKFVVWTRRRCSDLLVRHPGPYLLPYVLNQAAPGVQNMVQMDGVHHLLTLTPLLIKGLKIPDLIVHEALKANACCNGNDRVSRRQILPHCMQSRRERECVVSW